MFTSVQINVVDGSDTTHSSLNQAQNESLETFINRIKVTLEVHQGAMKDMKEKE